MLTRNECAEERTGDPISRHIKRDDDEERGDIYEQSDCQLEQSRQSRVFFAGRLRDWVRDGIWDPQGAPDARCGSRPRRDLFRELEQLNGKQNGKQSRRLTRLVIHIHLRQIVMREVTFRVFSFHLYFGGDTESTHTFPAKPLNLTGRKKPRTSTDKNLETHNDSRRMTERMRRKGGKEDGDGGAVKHTPACVIMDVRDINVCSPGPHK